MRLVHLILIVAIVGVLAGALFVLDLLDDAGHFRTIEPHFQGDCTPLAGVVGAEDLTIDHERGFVFISSFDRRAATRGAAVNGAIYGLDLNAENPRPAPLETAWNEAFRPHGLALYLDADGNRSLFVVNHRAADDHSIEIFDWRRGQLVHRETVRGELLLSPNDVVAVGPRQFYATNDHGHRSGIGRWLEDYLRLPRANVVYFDGESLRVAAAGIAYANGINGSPDGDAIYVAATTGRAVLIYDRDRESGALELRETLDAESGVDNIDVDRHGNLWIAAHPQLLRFVAHAGDAAERSPSQVLWVEPGAYRAPGAAPFTEAYLNDGGELSGSSVAAAHGSRLLIGSVFEEYLLLCTRG